MNSIIEAIAKTQAAIGKIAKENFNKHSKFKFASIDDFLAAVSGPMAENGLIVVTHERGYELVEKHFTPDKGQPYTRQWLSFNFGFELMHVTGENLPEVTRRVSVQWTGAQSYGAAQSYALKQYLRAQFLVATGDNDDPDHAPPETDPLPKSKPQQQLKPAHVPLTLEQVDEFEAIGKSETFDNHDHLSQFVQITCEKQITDLHSINAQKVIDFLKEQPDPQYWDAKKKAAWDLAKTVNNRELASE